MKSLFDAILSHDLKLLLEQIGYVGIFGIVFAESGLLVGFFLPGDSLLFTAGLMASPSFGFFNIWTVVLGSWIAAVLGDNVGYEFGKRVGRSLFRREKSLLFNPDNLIKAQEFYERHGGKAITLARFVPIVRTFAPIVAGVGNMDHKRFMFFNLLGGTLWTWGMTFGGYFLGKLIPDANKYVLPIILLIIVLSVLPPIIHLYKEQKRNPIEVFIEKVIRFFKYKIR